MFASDFPSCSEMFKRKRVRQCVLNRARILAHILCELLLADGLEFDLIQVRLQPRL